MQSENRTLNLFAIVIISAVSIAVVAGLFLSAALGLGLFINICNGLGLLEEGLTRDAALAVLYTANLLITLVFWGGAVKALRAHTFDIEVMAGATGFLASFFIATLLVVG